MSKTDKKTYMLPVAQSVGELLELEAREICMATGEPVTWRRIARSILKKHVDEKAKKETEF